MTNHVMRRVNRPGLNALRAFLVSALMVFSVAPSGAAFASSDNSNNANGNNGTLKVHEIGTPSGTENNDPKVCAFNLEGFDFDSSQSGYIMIDGQGQTSGSYGAYSFGPTDANGYAASQDFNNGGVVIPNGQYKATLYGKDTGGDIDLTNEKAKSKVFKVDCEEEGPTTGSLTVIKHVINDDNGTKVASDFTMGVTGTNVSDSSFAGAEDPGVTVTLDAGSYSIDEGDHTGYTETKSADCSGTIAAGETKTCTITNDDINPGEGGGGSGTLIIKKHVINDNGGTKVAGDFTMNVSATDASNPSFAGDENGVSVTVSPGSYSVEEGDHTGYTETKDADCSGTIEAGQTKTCVITNDDIDPGIGGGGTPTPTPETPVTTQTTLPETGAEDLPALLVSLAGAIAAYFRRKRVA